MAMATWDFDDEQASVHDLLDRVQSAGPQLVKRGDQRLIVVTREEWLRLRNDQTRVSETLPTIPQEPHPAELLLYPPRLGETG